MFQNVLLEFGDACCLGILDVEMPGQQADFFHCEAFPYWVCGVLIEFQYVLGSGVRHFSVFNKNPGRAPHLLCTDVWR